MKVDQTPLISSLTQGSVRDTAQGNKSFQSFLEAFDAGQAETSSLQGGVTQLGLMGWVDYERRREAEEAARAEVMEKWGLESEEDIAALSSVEARRFEAEVKSVTDDKVAQALHDGALEEMRKKESVLYRNTPLPPDDDGTPGF